MAFVSLKNQLIILVVTASLTHVHCEEVWSWGTEAPVNPNTPLPIEGQGQGAPSAVEPHTDGSRVNAGRFLGSHSSLCGNGLGIDCHHETNSPTLSTHYGVPAKDADLESSYTSYDTQDASFHETNIQHTLPFTDVQPPKNYKPVKHGAITGFIKQIGNKIHSIFPLGHKKHQKPVLSLPNIDYQPLNLKPTYTTPHFIQPTTLFVEPSITTQYSTIALNNPQPSIITHVHTHTHIHQGAHIQAPVPTSTVTITPVVLNVNTDFDENKLHATTTVTTTVHHHPQTTVAPTISKEHTHGTINPSTSNVAPLNDDYLPPNRDQTSGHEEECLCMPKEYCPSDNIIALTTKTSPKDISHLIDARNRKSDILSSVTEDIEIDEEYSTTLYPIGEETTDENITETSLLSDEEYSTTISPIDKDLIEETTTELPSTSEGINGTRVKRSLIFTSLHNNIKLDKNGRQINYKPVNGGCGWGDICCRSTSQSVKKAKSIQNSVCGKSKTNSLLGRVKTANLKQGETQFAEYPWQAAVLKKGNNGSIYVCGAVLIDDRHVLTAAHCVNGLQTSELLVRLGEWDFSQESEFFKHIDVQVSQVYEHENYYNGNLDNDITALRLRTLVDFNSNPHISPICLPSPSSSFNNQVCTVTGWGKDDHGNSGQYQRILQEVEVPVVEKQKCQEALQQTRLGKSFDLQDSMMCAGGKQHEDACKGDGGSPLVCPRSDGSYQLAGLVSWGIGCGQEGIPGVYVDITKYTMWIDTVRHS